MGLLDALGLMFVYLKLTEVIAWGWWWVLSPFWFQALLAAVTVLADKTDK